MKKLLFTLLFSSPLFLFAQIGLKAGINYANLSKASSINSSSRSGFHVGFLLAPPSKKIISSRTELIFSRQGFDYKNGTNTAIINHDYIQMGQLMSVNITKYFSLMFGAQTAYLISATADSSASNGNKVEKNISDLYNRVDYGYALGAELHPFKGLLLGARYNVSLNKLYKSVQTAQMPTFNSKDLKNNIVQFYLGYRLGTKKKDKK